MCALRRRFILFAVACRRLYFELSCPQSPIKKEDGTHHPQSICRLEKSQITVGERIVVFQVLQCTQRQFDGIHRHQWFLFQ
jgi:hypothetical protein